MANKSVKINFDFDNESVDFATDRVLSLTEQIRILKKELGKGDLTAKQFELLSTKLNETKDRFAATEARSRELFGTLSLLPGPIGEIASKIDGTISLLKTFSSFKLSDLRAQFAGFLADSGGIIQSLGKATGITKVYTVLNNALASSFVRVGVGEAAAATGARAFAAALTATGVGALVVGLGLAVSALMDFASASDEATTEQEQLNNAIERTNTLLDMDLSSAKRRQAERLADLKKNGATEKQLRDQGVLDLKENLKITTDALEEARKNENAILKSGQGDLKKAQDATLALENKQADLITSIKVAIVDNEIQTNKEIEAERQRAIAKKKKDNQDQKAEDEKILREQKEQADAAIEIEINKANTDRATLEKLLADRLALDKKTGNALELAKQKNAKIVQEAVDDDKKANDQRIKDAEDFNRKIQDIKTSAIVNEVEREKQARTDKFNRDLADLEKDKEFITKTETEKAEIRKNLRTAFDNDINKINQTQTEKEREEDLKRLDAKLRILELQGQSLLQGTRAYYENRSAILLETENKELAQLKADLDNKKISQEEYEKAVTATAKKYAEARKQLKQEEVAAVGKLVSTSIDAVAGLTSAIASSYDEEAKTSKDAFEKRKKLQIATALMSAASGIVQILTQPSVLPSPADWIVKGVNAAALAVATGVNISKIKKTTFEAPAAETQERRRLAQGGYVSGPGSTTSDSIPAYLSNGEFVMNARSTAAFLPILGAMNAAGNQSRFAAGGLAMTPSSMSNSEDITRIVQSSIDRPIKTYVVSSDMSTQQQFDRTIKSRSTI